MLCCARLALSAVPMRKVYFPKVAGISTPPRLIGMTFRESESTRLGEISDWELPIPEEDDDNIVQLVCFFAGDNKKTIEKVCKLEQKRFELLEAFSTLASPSLGVSRKDLTRSWRLEWVSGSRAEPLPQLLMRFFRLFLLGRRLVRSQLNL